jgi:hypothetical protein
LVPFSLLLPIIQQLSVDLNEVLFLEKFEHIIFRYFCLLKKITQACGTEFLIIAIKISFFSSM